MVMGARKFILLTIFVVLLGTSREAWAQKISIHMNNATLEEVLKKIKKKTKYDMMYQMKDVKEIDSRQSVHFDETELQEVLAFCLQGLPLDFHIYNQTIIITKKNTVPLPAMRTIKGVIRDEDGIILPSATILVKGSSRGTISDKNGQFSIRIPEGENTILITSYVGKKTCYTPITQDNSYTITLLTDVSEVEDVIVNGYQVIAKNEMTGATSTVNAKDIRTPGATSLEAAFQGALNGLEIMIPSGNIGSTGRMKVRGTSTIIGNPEPLIVVDGIIRENIWPFDRNTLYDLLNENDLSNSARSSIMGNNLSGINVDDIASITLLKDVSATAIYGIRASNGVIVITTKQGHSTRPGVRFRSDITFSPVPTYHNAKVMNSAQRVELSKEMIEAGIPIPSFPEEIGYEAAYLKMINKEISYTKFNEEVTRLEQTNTDWFKALGRTAISQNYHVSFNSGKDGMAYYSSFGYRKENSAYVGNDRETFTGMLNFNYNSSPKFKIAVNLSGYHITTSGYYTGINPEQYALTTSRTITSDQFYAKGKATLLSYRKNGTYQSVRNRVHFNMLHELRHTGNDNKTSEVNLNAQFTWNLLPYLNISVTPAYSQGTNDSQLWADAQSWNVAQLRGCDYNATLSEEIQNLMEYISPLPTGGILDYTRNTRRSLTVKGQINFRKTWGEETFHSVTATLGVETRKNKYDGKQGIEWGYVRGKRNTLLHDYRSTSDKFQQVQEQFPGIGLVESSDISQTEHDMKLVDRVENTFSEYGTIGYTYDSRYTICINVRNDASNRFGEHTNNRFYPVWSTGVRWDMHQEKWYPAKPWLNASTLRVSYGKQGNVVANVSPKTLVSHVPSDPITNESYLQLEQLPNPNLKWEKTLSWNVGIDLSLFQNNMEISFDYYKKETSDIVVEKEIPIENGFRKMYINSGAIDSEGYELQVKLSPLSTRAWSWTVNFTAAYMKDILKRSYTDEPALERFTNGNAALDGFPVSGFWSIPFIGLSPKNGAPLFAVMDQVGGEMQKVSGSLLDYLVYSGDSEPRVSGGISTTVRYKRFTLNAMFNYQLGHYKRLNPFITSSNNGMLSIPGADMNASTELLTRWQQPGDETHTRIPALSTRDEDVSQYLPDNSLSLGNYGAVYRYSLYNRSTERVVSASHLRCNRISLNYQTRIPRITEINLGITVTNPFIIKNRRLGDQDPEVMSMNADSYTPTMKRQQNYSISAEFIF
ncbi:SusC/RagA family TonB-linked outer membrane protein [Odoribacteraceae bacterium]|nr:SusC/RagA family TonB-linked outer membrane protein [Odoribacteraceae bacterium]GKH96094.1 SusC/RagA family TonB-linked outer membrane protein [Odoribacteraceae bacterium]GKI00158.1 SusC/RagA family TonB-linked outer membrane protein [Odoribacteraceae bacterium]GKI04685.1 SusC/RagA family TonB-linked outer membrane protein [Odoribacteraceae bacterium]